MARRSPTPSTLSQVLLTTIKERELTCYALAKMSGASATTIQRFVNGERGLSLSTAEKLAQALGLELVPRDQTGSQSK
jgi:plasmid maintenance system antidote protein VapI